MSEENSASDRLKARLTGAVALLIVGVVAWFWLLDADSPVEPVAQESTIPPAPTIQPFTVPQPQASADIKPVGSERAAPVQETSRPAPVAEKPVPDKPVAEKLMPAPIKNAPTKVTAKPNAPANTATKPAPAPTEKFEMDTNNLPVAWVVQVGAMATQASADKLTQQLIAKGFKAYSQPSKLANGSSAIKVFVGPKLSRERADLQKKLIDAELKTNTMVVRFPPT